MLGLGKLRDNFFKWIASSVNLSRPYGYLFPPFNGSDVVVSEDSVLSITAVQRALHLIANSIAIMPCEVTQFIEGGTVKVERSHPLYNMLKSKPNEAYNAFNFFYSWVWQSVFYGNGYAIIHYDDDEYRPIALSVVDQSIYSVDVYSVHQDLSKPPKVFYLIDGVQYPARKVLHLKGFSKTGIIGMNNLSLNAQNYKLPLSARLLGNEFFKRGAFLSGYLKFPTVLKDDAYGRIEDSWKKSYAGAGKAGGTPIIEQGGEFVQVQISPKDSASLETQIFSISEISRITGVPPHLLYLLDKATFDNIENMSIEFATYTLTPIVAQMEVELGNKLFLPSEQEYTRNRKSRFGVNFNMTSLLRGDSESRSSFYQKGIQGGWLKPNEVREIEGLSPVPGGEKTYMQAQMVPLDKINAPDDPIDAGVK